MQTNPAIDKVSHVVDGVRDFSLLKRLVEADERGALFAVKVKAEVSLMSESYDEVKQLMISISRLSTTYEFHRVEQHFIRSRSDWDNLRAVLASDKGPLREYFVFSELSLAHDDFEKMRHSLAEQGGLLFDVNSMDSQLGHEGDTLDS
ncbi:hypothetical protein ACI2KR_07705 [Pseudomonas luteola]